MCNFRSEIFFIAEHRVQKREGEKVSFCYLPLSSGTHSIRAFLQRLQKQMALHFPTLRSLLAYTLIVSIIELAKHLKLAQ